MAKKQPAEWPDDQKDFWLTRVLYGRNNAYALEGSWVSHDALFMMLGFLAFVVMLFVPLLFLVYAAVGLGFLARHLVRRRRWRRTHVVEPDWTDRLRKLNDV